MDKRGFIIEDLKNQIVRLTDERALFFALGKEQEEKNNQLQEENDFWIKQAEESAKRENELVSEVALLRKQINKENEA
ncbi:hypothetical protein SLL00_16495 [Metabacillus indicus]|uniref:hypothetical protein n=1 Tax=Metabacillus indicus TaxID=246786 RepID=UPI002A03542B|nr:hypothetical protein [Metabacillus indicus]MDX8291411.1 hypothetical protein [Metabacillus indicus]